jgi:anthranilate phosphoribosyltransferase
MLGPLVNPAQPNHQCVGVFSLNLARLYQYLHQSTPKKYCIIHAIDGYDEVSLTGEVKLITPNGEEVISPEYFSMERVSEKDIFGGNTVEEAATIFANILELRGTPAQNNVVLANAALGIQCFDSNKSIEECLSVAKESLFSGKALKAFKLLLSVK